MARVGPGRGWWRGPATASSGLRSQGAPGATATLPVAVAQALRQVAVALLEGLHVDWLEVIAPIAGLALSVVARVVDLTLLASTGVLFEALVVDNPEQTLPWDRGAFPARDHRALASQDVEGAQY